MDARRFFHHRPPFIVRPVFKKNKPDALGDRPPAMFVGDEETHVAPLVPFGPNEAAATQPDALRAVTEGAAMGRWAVLGPALLVVFIAGLGVAGQQPGESVPFLGIAALCALLGWAAHRYLVKQSKEFRLTDEGVVLEVRHRAPGKPRITRIPWAEMRVYSAKVGADEAFLYIVNDRGDTFTLHDHAARAGEFITRFVEQAERHGVAMRPATQTIPTPAAYTLRPGNTGCFLWVSAMMLMLQVDDRFELSTGQWRAGVALITLAGPALHLWRTLGDEDGAQRDRTSDRLMARLRRWLRRVLRIRVD